MADFCSMFVSKVRLAIKQGFKYFRVWKIVQGLVKLSLIMFQTDPGNAQKPYLGSYFIWIDPQKVLCQVPSAFWEMVPNFFLEFLKKCVRLTLYNLLAIREFVLPFQHLLHISCQSKTWQRFIWMCKARCWNGNLVLKWKMQFFWSLLWNFSTFFEPILRK